MKHAIVALVMSFLLFLPGCKRHQPDSQVVVRVFRDRNGPAAKRLDAAIRAIGTQNLRTAEGEPIIIATMELTTDSNTLARLGKDLRPGILILDSSANWRTVDFGSPSQESICPAPLTCVSGIPRWVQEEEREAAEIVLKAMGKQLREKID
jgi:hypothetical protein